jgi:hypothetical protein
LRIMPYQPLEYHMVKSRTGEETRGKYKVTGRVKLAKPLLIKSDSQGVIKAGV